MKKKRYILTNNCYFYDKPGKKRTPHYIEMVDLETGEVKQLKSGAKIEVITGKVEDAE